jgi:hypothetical protein
MPKHWNQNGTSRINAVDLDATDDNDIRLTDVWRSFRDTVLGVIQYAPGSSIASIRRSLPSATDARDTEYWMMLALDDLQSQKLIASRQAGSITRYSVKETR